MMGASMSGTPLTLMTVHAHPDDEASSTGGILARYSAEGVRTVLVTCTDGELGRAPGGLKPGDAAHHEAALAAMRRRQLGQSYRVRGVRPPAVLGHRGSGRE